MSWPPPRSPASAKAAWQRRASRSQGSIPGRVLEARAPQRVHDLDPSLMARPGNQDMGVTALLVPLIFRGQALGVLVALDPLGRDTGFSDEDEAVLVSFAASAATAVSTAQSVAEDRTRDSIAATERERGRWARELHDESLQSLAGLRVLLSAARRSDPEEIDRLLTQGIEQVDATIAEMRRLIADLRPPTLDELGLGAALEALGERISMGESIEVEMNVDLDFHSGRVEQRLVSEIEDTVYRLVQEALNNVVHHGETDQAWVEVTEGDEDAAGAGLRQGARLRPQYGHRRLRPDRHARTGGARRRHPRAAERARQRHLDPRRPARDPPRGTERDRGSGLGQHRAVEAVVRPVGTQVAGQRQVVAGALGLPRLGQRPAEAEVGVVVDLVALDHGLELDRGGGEAAGAEVGAAERLAHRGLLRGPARRLLQRRRRLLEVLLLEQLDAPPIESEGGVL